MVLAPTGVAAYNIQGSTLHRVLCLSDEHNKTGSYKPFNGSKLAFLRNMWKDAKCVIIDEISMVSYHRLVEINHRLNELKMFLTQMINLVIRMLLLQVTVISCRQFMVNG